MNSLPELMLDEFDNIVMITRNDDDNLYNCFDKNRFDIKDKETKYFKRFNQNWFNGFIENKDKGTDHDRDFKRFIFKNGNYRIYQFIDLVKENDVYRAVLYAQQRHLSSVWNIFIDSDGHILYIERLLNKSTIFDNPVPVCKGYSLCQSTNMDNGDTYWCKLAKYDYVYSCLSKQYYHKDLETWII